MKIVHYSHQLGIGGTEKCMQYFLEYLHDAGHDCYCIHNREKTDKAGGHREKLIQDILGKEKVLAYSSEEDFFQIMEKIRPDIFHTHRSGRPDEFPIIPRLKNYTIKCVETNIFGGFDPTDVIDLTLYINKYLTKSGRSLNRKIGYLYYPVKPPAHNNNLRNRLDIPPTTFVMGRIGRPDDYIFDPISLRALKIIEEKTDYDILYLVQSPPPAMIKTAKEMGLKKIKFINEPIVTDDEISSFYNTIDILAHARRDGETFGLNIAESMIHGKPVISHRSQIANGHKIFVKNCGFFAGTDNYKQYAKYIAKLYKNRELRSKLGEKGRKFAIDNFLLEKLGKKLESIYKELLTT
jgi:glycosyltransferase involved in cell wall biosynthesis